MLLVRIEVKRIKIEINRDYTKSVKYDSTSVAHFLMSPEKGGFVDDLAEHFYQTGQILPDESQYRMAYAAEHRTAQPWARVVIDMEQAYHHKSAISYFEGE